MRTCPIMKCGKPIAEHVFACRQHWFSLNKGEKEEVWDCYHEYVRDEIGVEELRRRQQVVIDAVDARLSS